ncbi:5-carboxymethyl-2-hydroxymuconate delta-isomerase [Sinomonas atrocyanea]|uniref:5-carboxymethyl-2-hydroxymuconate delta-isomerase n=1 Tax=Sinomonas atrocyanea TaxID=37927 RepID=A0A126ZXV7_9MICC|nr:fumarylacetoacetate hydrolase family protein [Sinomonas atrocyanea]AMM32008.1 5-carboxymethyl-2-hydroxymuconate delta-isomerase [Sinomonas atrocyanea]GEB65953.1 2-hydroxyhepta-2,4-diene-1,7-dioate isomerase [Sinomonas atrocyanea]GGG76895.1 2-hydroxyhepta-2,4-diene-1,7-dioate isomerase [Sinomonas atrocyanea]
MRVCRIAHADGTDYASWEGEEFAVLDDPFAHRPRHTGARIPAAGARLLAPVEPRTVVGMAHNTGAADRALPPAAFLKAARTVVGPGAALRLPDDAGRTVAEGELALVIGRETSGVRASDLRSCVLGFTVANDVTDRRAQGDDPLWTAAKSRHTFTPVGPWIETDLDPEDLPVTMTVNGAEASRASTAGLARDPDEILAYLARLMPLGPGDLVLTGAPGRDVPLTPGDSVSVRIDGLGELGNPVQAWAGRQEAAA